jgi:uncharacterized repeat protein (TIGR03803 family)
VAGPVRAQTFKTLYSFTAPDPNTGINSDGSHPAAGLLLSGDTLYGTASSGGSSGNGTVFKVNTDGTGFTTLHYFTATVGRTNIDGVGPNGIILSSSTLYGTTTGGGNSKNGTVFSISLPVTSPQLTIIPAGANVILNWPTNATGFTLQSTTNLALTVWTTNSPAPVVVNGQNTVISGTRQFFRLSQ